MSRSLHILIDNNLPKSLVAELGEFWHSTFPDWIVEHENDIAKPSTLDSHWIPRLNTIDSNRDWIVITKDKGAGNSKDKDKLPWLCKRHGHAYVIVLESLKTGAEQKAALASVWRALPLVIEACAKLKHLHSTHVKLGRHQVKNVPVGYLLRVKNEAIQTFVCQPASHSEPERHEPDAPIDHTKLKQAGLDL